MKTNVFVADGVVVERVGEDLVALVPHSEVVTLTGRAADVVGHVMAGEDVDPSDEAVVALVEAGVLTAPASLTRRKVMQLGAVATGVGVATLALPSVAAAASIPLTLQGAWYWTDEYASDQELPVDLRRGIVPDTWSRTFVVFLDDSYTLPNEEPSALTAFGQQFAHANLFAGDPLEQVAPGSEGALVFSNSVSPGPAIPKTEPLEGDLTGSFTWAGVTYQVTFDQAPDQPES